MSCNMVVAHVGQFRRSHTSLASLGLLGCALLLIGCLRLYSTTSGDPGPLLDGLGGPREAGARDGARIDLAQHDGTLPCPTLPWTITDVATVGQSTVSIVDGSADLSETSLALDSLGQPHLAYVDANRQVLVYSSYRGGSWQPEDVDGSGNPIASLVALALDARDTPQLAYHHDSGCHLAFATRGTSTWQLTDLEPSGVGQAIAVDGAGKVHLAYAVVQDAPTPYPLRRATNRTGSWSSEQIGTVSGYLGRTSLALDGEGHAHLAYYDPGTQDLYYASDAQGSAWRTELVDFLGQVGEEPSLGLLPGQGPVIAYFDRTNGDLKLAEGLPAASGHTWRLTAIDRTGDVGRYPSLVTRAGGAVYISYYDATHKALKLARRLSATADWELEVVEAGGATADPGYGSSLAISADRRAHLAYYELTSGKVRYAVNSCR